MESVVTIEAPERTRERPTALPWYVVAMAIGATSVVVGVLWDISWHKTIGRDTFWTPAHMAIYLGGLIGGFGGGWLALRTTFGGGRDAGVRFWGFRAPLGAWLAIWGAIAMLTSAPFDDWWHNAYGLDVKILSPPHTVLSMGIIAIVVGALLLALAEQNRSPGRRTAFAFCYVAGMLVASLAIFASEYTITNRHHSSIFYGVICGVFPLLLVGPARASRLRWPATSAAAVYMGIYVTMILILPRFPAEPLLGPIYTPLDAMVPPYFPMLLIVPAFFIDLLLRRLGSDSPWRSALVLGAVFFATFLVAQWVFADFLLSPAADNFFFVGGRSWAYVHRPGAWQTRFWGEATGRGLAVAAVLALLSARLGLGWGAWMARVRR
jgi:hypothetical protein